MCEVDPGQPDRPERDRIILSKGHAISAHYAVLAMRGYFPVDDLLDFNANGSSLPEQPSPGCVPGIEVATGSLGHGLPLGLGMTLAAPLTGQDYRVVVVMSDGECNEGSVWEAAMMAPKHRSGRLLTIVDYNKWQATGRSQEIMALDPLSQKWEAFGWHAQEVDGHDLEALGDAIAGSFAEADRPSVIVAHTVKGKGISFMEDDNNWHYRSPSEDEVALAARELGLT